MLQRLLDAGYEEPVSSMRIMNAVKKLIQELVERNLPEAQFLRRFLDTLDILHRLEYEFQRTRTFLQQLLPPSFDLASSQVVRIRVQHLEALSRALDKMTMDAQKYQPQSLSGQIIPILRDQTARDVVDSSIEYSSQQITDWFYNWRSNLVHWSTIVKPMLIWPHNREMLAWEPAPLLDPGLWQTRPFVAPEQILERVNQRLETGVKQEQVVSRWKASTRASALPRIAPKKFTGPMEHVGPMRKKSNSSGHLMPTVTAAIADIQLWGASAMEVEASVPEEDILIIPDPKTLNMDELEALPAEPRRDLATSKGGVVQRSRQASGEPLVTAKATGAGEARQESVEPGQEEAAPSTHPWSMLGMANPKRVASKPPGPHPVHTQHDGVYLIWPSGKEMETQRLDLRKIPSYVVPSEWKGQEDYRFVKEAGWVNPLPMMAVPEGFKWRICKLPEDLPAREHAVALKLKQTYHHYIWVMRNYCEDMRKSIYRLHYPASQAGFNEIIFSLNAAIDLDPFFQQFRLEWLMTFYLSIVLQTTQAIAHGAVGRMVYKAQKQHPDTWFYDRLFAASLPANVQQQVPALMRAPHQQTDERRIELDNRFLNHQLDTVEYSKLGLYFTFQENGQNWPDLGSGPNYFAPPARFCTAEAIQLSNANGDSVVWPYEGILTMPMVEAYDQGAFPPSPIMASVEKAFQMAEQVVQAFLSQRCKDLQALAQPAEINQGMSMETGVEEAIQKEDEDDGKGSDAESLALVEDKPKMASVVVRVDHPTPDARLRPRRRTKLAKDATSYPGPRDRSRSSRRPTRARHKPQDRRRRGTAEPRPRGRARKRTSHSRGSRDSRSKSRRHY